MKAEEPQKKNEKFTTDSVAVGESEISYMIYSHLRKRLDERYEKIECLFSEVYEIKKRIESVEKYLDYMHKRDNGLLTESNAESEFQKLVKLMGEEGVGL